MAHSLNPKRNSTNVYLTRLSPKQQISIHKPLLGRSGSKYAVPNPDGESLKEMTPQEIELHNQTLLQLDQGSYFSSKFKNTFGFSHGIGGQNYSLQTTGGIQVGGKKKGQKKRSRQVNEPKMQICFSIASGISTRTRRMDESFSVIPDVRSKLDVHAMKDAASRLEAQHAQNAYANQITPTATKMASQLKIMDELGKVCRDSPISIVEGEDENGNRNSQRDILRNETVLSLGYRQPDNPVQLISYLTKQNKQQKGDIVYNMLPYRKPIKSNSKVKLPEPVRLPQTVDIEKQQSQNSQYGTNYAYSPPPALFNDNSLTRLKEHKQPIINNTLYNSPKKIPSLVPKHVAAMYQTVGEFGTQAAAGQPQAMTEHEQQQQHLAGKASQKRLPRIIFALAEETDDDTLSQLTAGVGHRNTVFFPGGPKLNNPLLPVHLNRDLSTISSPLEKKFELPPQATLAMYNAEDGMVCHPPLLSEDDKPWTYQPKWTKVANSRNHFGKAPKSSAVAAPSKDSLNKRNQSVPRPRIMPPAFMITSPSSVSKNVAMFPRREDGREQPFVGNYNVPKQPFTLPDGTLVQANPLKNTFTKFKEQAQLTLHASKEQKTKSAMSMGGKKKTTIRVSAGDQEIVVDSEQQQEALIQAVRRITLQNAVRKDQIFSQLRRQPSEQTEQRSASPGSSSPTGSQHGNSASALKGAVKPQALSITFAQMKEQYKRKGTFYQNQMCTSGKPSPTATAGGEQSTTDLKEKMVPTLVDVSSPQNPAAKSPSFTFQANSPTGTAGGRAKQQAERAMRSTQEEILKNLNPKEIKRLLFQTVNLSQEQEFSANPGLKIQGQNLGHNPSTLVYQQRLQAVDLAKQQGVQTSSRPFLPTGAAPPEGGSDSQAALNADLMLNNIYKSGEFAEVDPDGEKEQKAKKDGEEGGGPAPPLLKGRLDSKSSLDMKEAEASLASAAASVAEVGQQVAIATATSREMTPATINATSTNDLVGAKNVSELKLDAKQPNGMLGGPTSIKNISQTAITRDLDVETNYLRNSAQNFTEELPMKTVFQKRGPQLPEEQAKNANQQGIREEHHETPPKAGEKEQTSDVVKEESVKE